MQNSEIKLNKMTLKLREILQNGISYDETDRMPDDITIPNFIVFLYFISIILPVVDLGMDINVLVRYFLAEKMIQFWCTLVFILLPAFVNIAVYIRMYTQDRTEGFSSEESTAFWWLRIAMLVLLQAPMLGSIYAFIYLIKSQQAERKGDTSQQRYYFGLVLREDSDGMLMRLLECCLEAAPQCVLQISFLMSTNDHLTLHQGLSIASSAISMGWCLASYQRAIRLAQDKDNISWTGTGLQTAWYLLLMLSRVLSLSIFAYIFPTWMLCACVVRIVFATAWIHMHDKPGFCKNEMASLMFSIVLGTVYLFTFVQLVEKPTRYRYATYYSMSFIENVICCVLWYFYVDDVVRNSIYFYPILIVILSSFVIGLAFMIIYYSYFHPKQLVVINSQVRLSRERVELRSELS